MKLQQAYISEAVAIGDWEIIGYKGPGDGDKTSSSTTNFEYKDGVGFTEHKINLSTGVDGWSASNKTKLNDCAVDVNWVVNVKGVSGTSATSGDAAFDATTKCTDLTPNFDKIGS